MIDAGHYRISDTLRNGVAVTIRSIRPDDKEKIVEAFRSLEKESVYTRFFRYKKELTDEDLKVATEVRLTEPPTEEELRILREELDPQGIYLKQGG